MNDNISTLVQSHPITGTGFKYEYSKDGLVLGRASLYIMTNDLHSRPFGLLEDVYISSACRGEGIGTMLTERIIDKAKELNCYKLICTSRYSKPRVHALYERLGFKDHGKEFRIDF